MKSILVIQLCRYGDLIQSTPALGALRRRWPDARISLLARRSFGGVLAGISEVDEIIEWDAGPLVQEWSAKPFGERLALLREFVKPLRSRKFELVCNLSNDVPSALLTYLMRPRRTVGLTFCRDRRYRVKDDWSRHLFLATDLRRLNSLNLTDLLIRACEGNGPMPPHVHSTPEDERFAEDLLGPVSQLVIGMQVGAIKPHKRWPLSSFKELAFRLASRGAAMLFFGSDNERAEISSIVDPLTADGATAVNLAGETTFGGLAALLKRCRLLISNDTATIHVAAAVSTPCLALTFATTNAWDTGPYGEGHFILEPTFPCYPCAWHSQCSRLSCRDLISVEAVQASIEYALGTGADLPDLEGQSVVLSKSCWMPDGFLGLRPVNRPALTMKDVLRFLHRAYHLKRLNRMDPCVTNLLPDWVGDYRINDPELLAREALAAAEDLASLRNMAALGERAAHAAFVGVSSPQSMRDMDRISGAVECLQQNILVGEQNDALKSLIAGFRHNLVDMEARDAREAAAIHRWNYRALAQGCTEIENGLRAFAASLTETEKQETPDRKAFVTIQ
jgi:ADP-heptose:LPS heptosyltransferase